MNYLTPAGVAPWFTGSLLTEIATALRAAEALRATAAPTALRYAAEDVVARYARGHHRYAPES